MTPFRLLMIVAGAIGIVVLLNALFIVRETEQAMVLTFGKIDRVIAEPGLHFKTPFVQNLVFYDKRILSSDSQPEEIVTKDKKRAVVDSFTRWRIADAEKFFQALSTQNNAVLRLNMIVNSNLRRQLALWDLQDIVSNERDKIMKETLEAARAEAAPLGVEIVDVRIKRVDLPHANSEAIYRRMQAERQKEAKEIRAKGAEEADKIRADADRQKTILLAEAQRDAEKLRGEGDAQAIKVYAGAYGKDPEFFKLQRTLEAYKNSLSDGTMMVLDPSIQFLEKLKNGSR